MDSFGDEVLVKGGGAVKGSIVLTLVVLLSAPAVPPIDAADGSPNLGSRDKPAIYGFKTVGEVKDKLRAGPKAKELFDHFERNGGTVQSDDSPPSGADFEPETNIIRLDSKRLKDINDATTSLLYELMRYKHNRNQIDLDLQAKDGRLTKEQYATQCEKWSYMYLAEHSAYAKDGIANGGWDPDTDQYDHCLKPGGAFETFDKYLAHVKMNSPPLTHYQCFVYRYEWLRRPLADPRVEALENRVRELHQRAETLDRENRQLKLRLDLHVSGHALTKIKSGMPRKEVEEILGRPDRVRNEEATIAAGAVAIQVAMYSLAMPNHPDKQLMAVHYRKIEGGWVFQEWRGPDSPN